MKFFAYELLASDKSDSLYVDSDPITFLKRLAADINEAEGVIEGLTIGTVNALDINDGLNEIRCENWIGDDTYGNYSQNLEDEE